MPIIFFLLGTDLMYRPPNSNLRLKVVTSNKELNDILWNFHSAPFAGHSGINATINKISQRYYWKGIKDTVKDYVSMI